MPDGAPLPALRGAWWRYAVLLSIVAGSLVALMAWPPIGQDARYHALADRRTMLGIPNVGDVVSNLAFLAVGVAGVRLCMDRRNFGARAAWTVFFAGVALVAVGSAWYHWSPRNATLVWDRLPMTVAFMGLFVALVAEHLGMQWERWLLGPAVLAGLGTVLYWAYSDDLRPYVWIQAAPLLTIIAMSALFRSDYGGSWYLVGGLLCYIVAKFCELYDRPIFSATGGTISGHTLKHLLAALACFMVYAMLARRVDQRRLPSEHAPSWVRDRHRRRAERAA